jgi:predicted dehydrogenase
MELGWGILGYGRISNVFEESFRDINSSKLIAVASNSKILKNKLKNNTIQIHSSYEKLLENKAIDVVYIANTNNLHKDTIIKAANYKKNILVEKPAFLNINDFNECIKLIKKKNIFFMEAIMYLHHPQITKIAEIILNGEIGNIINIKANMGFNINKTFFGFIRKNADTNGRLLNKNLGGGAINDLGCYPVSAVNFLSKLMNNKILEIKNIKARSIFSSTKVDTVSSAYIEFNNNFYSELNVAITKNFKNILEIVGDKGVLKIFNPWTPNYQYKINIKKNFINNKTYNFNCKKTLYAYQIDDVTDSINKGNKETAGYGMKWSDTNVCTNILDAWKKSVNY